MISYQDNNLTETRISIRKIIEKTKLKVEKFLAWALGLYSFLIANIIISLTIIFFYGQQISAIFNGPPVSKINQEISNARISSPSFPIPISITTPKTTATSTTIISPVTEMCASNLNFDRLSYNDFTNRLQITHNPKKQIDIVVVVS